MRILNIILLLAIVGLSLCGCGISGEVENQAYVLSMGIDRNENGEFELTARIPQIGKGSETSEDEDGDSDYLLFSATGDTYAQALAGLQRSTRREMNLSHIGSTRSPKHRTSTRRRALSFAKVAQGTLLRLKRRSSARASPRKSRP